MRKILLRKTAHEQLIGQLVFIEENMDDLINLAISSKCFSSSDKAEQFFLFYIRKIESLFRSAEIAELQAETSMLIDRIPYIILGCRFQLLNDDNIRYNCQLTYDLEYKGRSIPVFYLSDAGMDLIFRKRGETATVDIGHGLQEYTIGSITIL